MKFRSRLVVSVVASGVLAAGLTACGGTATSPAAQGKIEVVASTNVWASVVSAVGSDQVNVKSIINDPAADPHSFEATPADVVSLQSAQLALYNGGGYDDFFNNLLAQAPDVRAINAFDASGKAAENHESGHAHSGDSHGHEHEHGPEQGDHQGHEHGESNEHVWYDLPTVGKVADQVATALGEIKPEARQVFMANASEFKGRINELTSAAQQIGEKRPGAKALATEPVAHYFLDGAGIQDVTPADFSSAIEAETDVPAAALAEVNQLISGRTVNVVLNNSQTVTPATSQVVDTAKSAGIPVVDVTETLPANSTDYIAWMRNHIDALTKALTSP